MESKPILIKGGLYRDERGSLQYVNDENTENYKRFYIITHPDIDIVRAWQGHKTEEKSFFVIKGFFTVAVVQPQNFEAPSSKDTSELFKMKSEDNLFLKVPGGCYTGIKACEPNSILLVLSSSTLEESKSDNFRLPKDMWVEWQNIK